MLMMTADELLQLREVKNLLKMAILDFDYDFKETLGVVPATKLRKTCRSFPSRNLLDKRPQRHN
jgi:hypothetical protein